MRAWISAELDGELSEFESILLRGHLARCEACSAFESSAASFAVALRSAPLEPLSQPVTLPHRHRIALASRRIPAVAALAVLMIGFGGVFASLHSGAILDGATPSAASAFDDQSARELQRQTAVAALAQLRARRAEANLASVQIPRRTGFQNP